MTKACGCTEIVRCSRHAKKEHEAQERLLAARQSLPQPNWPVLNAMKAEVDEAMGIAYFIEGDMIGACYLDFQNLQESPAGFGETREIALADLQANSEVS